MAKALAKQFSVSDKRRLHPRLL